MMGISVKEKIDANNKIIESLLSPNIFTLNNTVSELLAENRELQKLCPHSYDENGVCVYCYKIKEE